MTKAVFIDRDFSKVTAGSYVAFESTYKGIPANTPIKVHDRAGDYIYTGTDSSYSVHEGVTWRSHMGYRCENPNKPAVHKTSIERIVRYKFEDVMYDTQQEANLAEAASILRNKVREATNDILGNSKLEFAVAILTGHNEEMLQAAVQEYKDRISNMPSII